MSEPNSVKELVEQLWAKSLLPKTRAELVLDAQTRYAVEQLEMRLALECEIEKLRNELEKERSDKSAVIRELNETRDLNRKCCDENDSLRSLVNELADALDGLTCHADCDVSQDDVCDDDCYHVKNRALVVKAREVLNVGHK